MEVKYADSTFRSIPVKDIIAGQKYEVNPKTIQKDCVGFRLFLALSKDLMVCIETGRRVHLADNPKRGDYNYSIRPVFIESITLRLQS